MKPLAALRTTTSCATCPPAQTMPRNVPRKAMLAIAIALLAPTVSAWNGHTSAKIPTIGAMNLHNHAFCTWLQIPPAITYAQNGASGNNYCRIKHIASGD